MKKFFLYLLSFSFFISVEPQSWRDPYDGITDIRILPMLKNLSKEHIGTNINPKDGRLLHDLIIKKGYKKGLEIGTSYGYSTLWLGLAFKQNNGKLITIEIDPEKAREAEKNFHHAGLNH
ncbi:MAG: class I SAM-dependent methyltransferase, partial [Leptospiraceae bacterium]|nr:class I SAM-dependent methyltransferase [Leptospiraceae bacterium]